MTPPLTEETPILIVDDEEPIHRALQRSLRREPYELLHAYDAAEAAAILRRRPDVRAVLCDHYMPGTQGLDLLMEIRRSHPDLVTILLTAQADLQLVIAAINEGHVDRFFTKPWNGDELRTQLRALVFGGRRAPSAAGAKRGTSERLKSELVPERDDHTGAFLIDPADFDPDAA